MPILFSDHAEEQRKKRSIPKQRIIDAIQDPEAIRSIYRRRKLRQKMFGDRILEVVTITEGPRIMVITAYYVEKNK